MKTLINYIQFVLMLPFLLLWWISVLGMKIIYPEFLGTVLRYALEDFRNANTR